jgi:hypothetical protein
MKPGKGTAENKKPRLGRCDTANGHIMNSEKVEAVEKWDVDGCFSPFNETNPTFWDAPSNFFHHFNHFHNFHLPKLLTSWSRIPQILLQEFGYSRLELLSQESAWLEKKPVKETCMASTWLIYGLSLSLYMINYTT